MQKDRELQAAKLKAKQEKARKKKELEERLKKVQTEHGGLHGTEDTGYDDDAMSLYIKGDNADASNVQIGAMLTEHRNHVLIRKINEDY